MHFIFDANQKFVCNSWIRTIHTNTIMVDNVQLRSKTSRWDIHSIRQSAGVIMVVADVHVRNERHQAISNHNADPFGTLPFYVLKRFLAVHEIVQCWENKHYSNKHADSTLSHSVFWAQAGQKLMSRSLTLANNKGISRVIPDPGLAFALSSVSHIFNIILENDKTMELNYDTTQQTEYVMNKKLLRRNDISTWYLRIYYVLCLLGNTRIQWNLDNSVAI